MNKAKITVLKRMANRDLIEQYMGDEYKARDIAPCSGFEDGQEFLVENPGTIPEGFCGWAWAIRRPLKRLCEPLDRPRSVSGRRVLRDVRPDRR